MRITTAAASLLGCTILLGSTAHAQAARNYDCTKPGNANKTACKTAAAAPAPTASATPAASAPPAKAERHYDCSKAGNANKAACKGTTSASAPANTPAAAPVAKKPSLLDRLRGHPAAAPAAANSNQAPAAPAATGAHTGKSITSDPAGATGQCKDGSYTHATHHSGACSHHGGVTKWMNG